MSRGKKVTRQTLIGEAGIALIHGRVTEMGFLFHPRRVDHGIDGHIDLVDPGTGEVLNLVLQVQSKASTRQFPYEDVNGFQYTCDEIDLNYWLSGNTPVILVLSHPDEGGAWWVDIKAEFSDPKRRASRTVVVDKHTQAFDASAAAALLGRAAPKGRGLFLSPPPKLETLTSNLLRVERMPEALYIAPSAASTYSAAGELLASQSKRARGDWILRNSLVISFSDLTQSPLNVLCSGDVERHDTGEWAGSDEQDIQHRLMDLLARAVGADHHADLRWHKDRRHLHFRPTPDLAPRREGRGPGRQGRTVFSAYRSKRDPGKISFYRHAAVTTRFRRLGDAWYCQLGVDYCFSRDGHNESAFADALLAGIKRFDRHAAVAGWTKTWATYFGKPPNLFDADKAVIFGELATLEVDRGIEDRLWGRAPLQISEEDGENRANQAENEAELAAAGIEQEDLFALLAEDYADQDEPVTPPRTQSHRRRRNPDKTDRPKRRGDNR